MSNIKKLVHGVGINDGIIPTYKNGKRLKEYEIWKSLLARCYSKYKHQIQPTYKDCIVSENFKNYSYFYEWCQNQTFFNHRQEDNPLPRRAQAPPAPRATPLRWRCICTPCAMSKTFLRFINDAPAKAA